VKLRHRPVRNDPKLCREISDLIGGPEGALAAMEEMIGKDLTQQLLEVEGRPKRARKAGRR
jgi:hypothetical protein